MDFFCATNYKTLERKRRKRRRWGTATVSSNMATCGGTLLLRRELGWAQNRTSDLRI